MNPVHFKGPPGRIYRVLEAPPNYDHEGLGECIGLPCEIVEGEWIKSVWKPTPEDLALLNAGGGIPIFIHGPQPVMAVGPACEPDLLLVEA